MENGEVGLSMTPESTIVAEKSASSLYPDTTSSSQPLFTGRKCGFSKESDSIPMAQLTE
jgi:hypothetical protein